jgi:RimJ/RimL family protein N-acetyltransferase
VSAVGRFAEVDLDGLILSGPRLTLRPWRPDDAHAVAAAMRDPEMHRWLHLPLPYETEDAVRFVSSYAPQARASAASLECAVEDAGELVGAAALRLPGDGHPHADVGYWVVPGARGRGYAAEAVRVLTSWGLGLGLARIELECDVRNLPSVGTASAAGFRFEGVLRDRLRAPSGDAAVFARLPSDAGEAVPAAFARLPPGGVGDGTITLRPRLPEDAEDYLAQERDPLTLATGFTDRPPREEDVARACARSGLDWLVGSTAHLTVLDDATGAFAGSVQIRLAGPPSVGGIGYTIHPAFRGRGYTARALRLLVPWAFDASGFTRLELGAKTSNVASQRAAERAGFRPDGVRAARLRNPDGSFSDEVRYALVNPAISRAGGSYSISRISP